MVTLKIIDANISPGVEWLATDWILATDLLFKDIVNESLEDKVNIKSITFDDVLDPAIKYYAKARILLSTGYTIESNEDIFLPKI